ncbi:MAG: NAD-dependent epimerase/dehydratase family protein [Erysipelotrichaceae bacterium]
MKILIIGGTGTISAPICETLAKKSDVQLTVLNRGNKKLPAGAKQIIGDFNDFATMSKLAEDNYDVVINFIVFTQQQAQQEIEIFTNKVKQYIFISTVATYDHENHLVIDENTPQGNIYSLYGQNKTACEKLYLNSSLPVTIVRPSQTYNNDRIPLSVKGNSCYSVIDRIINNKPVIIHGDGKSTWHCTNAVDFAKYFIHLVGNYQSIGEAYHIINEELVTWDMIYHHLAKLLNKEITIYHLTSDFLALSTKYPLKDTILADKQYSVIYKMDKIKAISGDIKMSIDIKAGLENYLNYLAKNPEFKIKDPKFDDWCDNLIEIYQKFIESSTNCY